MTAAPIDPVAAALDAIAAYFQANVTGLTARRGWPEASTELDLDAGPVLTLVAADASGERCAPSPVDKADNGDGTVLVTYRVGWLTINAQLDLWCAYRAQRDDMVAAIEAAAANQLPRSSAFWLSSTTYYERPLTIEMATASYQDIGDTAPRGEWRKTWNLAISTDLVAQATSPKLAQVALRLSTVLAGVTITEPDRLVPGA